MKSMMKFAIPALMAVASPAVAQNLVTNGGFETGDFTGWTQGGNLGYTSVSAAYAHTGAFGARLGPVGSNGILSQTLATVAGQYYDLSFWHFYPGATPSYFEVQWNGTDVYPAETNATSPTSYTEYSYTSLRGTGADTLTFTFRNDPSYQGLDDVSVTRGTGSAVPEPATWAMMVLGFGLVGYGLRRRQQAVRVTYA